MSNTKNDPYEGVGGSYVVDPKTGERKRVEGPALPGEPAADAPPTKSKPAPRRSTESQE
jgi:hypothetical protein